MGTSDARYQALAAAIDEGSLSAAAEKLGYTPSGIVRLVNALEQEVGFPLLVRNSRGVKATKEGQAMLSVIRDILHSHRAADQLAARIRGLSEGSITVGSKHSPASLWLPRILVAFQAAHPKVRVNVLERNTEVLLDLINSRRADCCLLTAPQKDYEWLRLGQSELVAWLPRDHPQAQVERLSLDSLQGMPFIRTYSGYEMDSDPVLSQAAIKPNIRFTVSDCYTAFCMVEAGLGICLGIESMTNSWKGKVAMIPLDPPQRLEFGIAYLAQRLSPATQEFITCARHLVEA